MDDRLRIKAALDEGRLTREQLAEALSVSVFSIGRLYRLERELKARERRLALDALGLDDGGPQLREVPVIGMIAAGAWAEAINDPIGYTFTSRGGAKAFALRVDGDSMDLIVRPGANVIVDPDKTDLLDGKSYALMNHEGEATFKRFRLEPARFEPVSTNPMHSIITIGREPFTIIGQAVEATRDL